MPYNPNIASVFFRSGEIEAWGRGIEKITASCKHWGMPDPFYRVRVNEVMIGFDTDANTVDITVDEYGEKFTNEFTKKFTNDKTKKAIVDMMLNNPSITALAMSETIGITRRAILKSIAALKEEGVVERVGSARGGHWLVKIENVE